MPPTLSPKILALDTSTPRGSIALLEGETVAAEFRLFSLQTHSARLLRSIDFLLSSAGWTLDDIGLVAAGTGPGSFTGIRIGISTALGLAQSLSIPFSGICGLDALAHQVAFVGGRIATITDAQRSQVYYAEYIAVDGLIRTTKRPALYEPAALGLRLRRRKLYVVGDSALRCFGGLTRSSSAWPRCVEVDLFLASPIGRLALKRRRTWKTGAFLTAEPLYVRPADAMKPKVRKR